MMRCRFGLPIRGRGYWLNVMIDTGYRHTVVGAIHEIVMTTDDPDVLSRAIAHEIGHCRAARLVVDVSAVDGFTEHHVASLGELAANGDRAAVRVSPLQYLRLEPILTAAGVMKVITDRSLVRSGRPKV